MAATEQSVNKVLALVGRMKALLVLRNQARLSVSNNPDAQLTDQQIADQKAAMLVTYQALRDAVKTEVQGW